MKKQFLISVFSLILVSPSYGEEADGGTAGAFLQIPTGARPTAMGGAYISISDDGAAPLFNPAGISGLKRAMISSAYRTLRLDRKLGYFSALFPVQGDAALGVNWRYAGTGSFGARDDVGFLTGEEFSMNNHQFSVIFAKRFEKYLSVGSTISYLYSTFPHVNVATVGFDFGAIFHIDNLINRERRASLPIKDIRVGLVVKNLAKELNWNNEEYIFRHNPGTLGSIQDDKIPIDVGLGISARFLERKLLLATDLSKNEEQNPVFRAGSEYFVTKKFALRGGYGNQRLTTGAGFIFAVGSHVLSIDYAFATDKVDEGSEHIFSFDLLL